MSKESKRPDGFDFLDREYHVKSALHGSDVPVAEPFHLCLDESIIGSVFYPVELMTP